MKILSKPKGNAEEYGRWSVNPYVGCPHGCKYCYLKKGVWAKGLGGSSPKLKKGIVNEEHAYHVAMAEILENREQIIKDGGLFMTFTSDPCIEETINLFLKIMSASIQIAIPVTLLTKVGNTLSAGKHSYSLATYIRQWMYKEDENLVALGVTLTGHDELEPNASSNEERIRVLRCLSESKSDIHLWASIEPVIDFKSSYDMILAACDAGCRHFKIGLMTKNTKVCRKMYDYDACIEFIHDVMRVMEAGGGTATVYWKQSFRDFLGEEDFARATVGYKNIVDKDWSMFNK
jgi:DNA repair photolyase